jgi:hypothetical protein
VAAPEERLPGLRLDVFTLDEPAGVGARVAADSLPALASLRPAIDLEGGDAFEEYLPPFRATLRGSLRIDQGGAHAFRLDAAGHAWLTVNGVRWTPGTPLELAAGEHELRVDYVCNSGAPRVRLELMPPGSDGFAPVPPGAFSTLLGDTSTAEGPAALATAGDADTVPGIPGQYALRSLRPADLDVELSGLALLPDGRLAVSSPAQDGSLWLLEGAGGGGTVRATRLGAGFDRPGPVRVHEGRPAVHTAQGWYALEDTTGDGGADVYRIVDAPAPGTGSGQLTLVHGPHAGWVLSADPAGGALVRTSPEGEAEPCGSLPGPGPWHLVEAPDGRVFALGTGPRPAGERLLLLTPR